MEYWLSDDSNRHPLLRHDKFLSGVWSVVGLTFLAGFAVASSDQIAHGLGFFAGACLAVVLIWVRRTPSATAQGIGLVFALALAPALLWLTVPSTSAQELRSVVEEIQAAERARAEWEKEQAPLLQLHGDTATSGAAPLWGLTPGDTMTLPIGNQFTAPVHTTPTQP